MLQENFSVQLSLAAGKGKAKARGEAAREALTDLSVISLMARVEYASSCLIDEQQTAMTALKQFETSLPIIISMRGALLITLTVSRIKTYRTQQLTFTK